MTREMLEFLKKKKLPIREMNIGRNEPSTYKPVSLFPEFFLLSFVSISIIRYKLTDKLDINSRDKYLSLQFKGKKLW